MPRNVATVDDFDKLKNELGLVPMEFLLSTITENVGDIRGAEPYTALRWYNEGLAQPVGKLATAPAQKQKVKGDSEADRKAAIEIPTNWSDSYHLQRIALAKKIAGSDASLNTEQADTIIQDELARRAGPDGADGAGAGGAGGAGGGPNALTTQQTPTL